MWLLSRMGYIPTNHAEGRSSRGGWSGYDVGN